VTVSMRRLVGRVLYWLRYTITLMFFQALFNNHALKIIFNSRYTDIYRNVNKYDSRMEQNTLRFM